MGFYSFVRHVPTATERDVSGAPGVVLARGVGLLWAAATVSAWAAVTLEHS